MCCSVSVRLVETGNITAIRTSPAPSTQKISGVCLTTAETSYNACTYVSTSSCDHPFSSVEISSFYRSLILFEPTKVAFCYLYLWSKFRSKTYFGCCLCNILLCETLKIMSDRSNYVLTISSLRFHCKNW